MIAAPIQVQTLGIWSNTTMPMMPTKMRRAATSGRLLRHAGAGVVLLESGPPLAAPSDLRHYTLLHVDNRDGWSEWFKAAGVQDIQPARGPIFPNSALAAQSAALGHGVALGCWLLSAEDLTSGRLLRASITRCPPAPIGSSRPISTISASLPQPRSVGS